MLAEALRDVDTREKICEALASQPKAAKPADNVTFAVVETGEPHILVEDHRWHDWWRGYFPRSAHEDRPAEPALCLLTGELLDPAHPSKDQGPRRRWRQGRDYADRVQPETRFARMGSSSRATRPLESVQRSNTPQG